MDGSGSSGSLVSLKRIIFLSWAEMVAKDLFWSEEGRRFGSQLYFDSLPSRATRHFHGFCKCFFKNCCLVLSSGMFSIHHDVAWGTVSVVSNFYTKHIYQPKIWIWSIGKSKQINARSNFRGKDCLLGRQTPAIQYFYDQMTILPTH